MVTRATVSVVPILQVTALPQPLQVDLGDAATALAHAAAAALGEPPNGVWVTWQTLEPGLYSEGGDAPAAQPRSTHPPVVRILALEGRPPDLVERVLADVAEAVVRELGLESGNAFVHWETLRAGTVYTGGRVVR